MGNSETFSVDLRAIKRCADDISKSKAACSMFGYSGIEALDLSKWTNTITVTGKGSVIIKLHWKEEPFVWKDVHSRQEPLAVDGGCTSATGNQILNVCSMICYVLHNCC